MRYLHSENPRRFHGRLTSFNCVIDARWVLKITDYSLSSIYQAQGLEMMLKRESKGCSCVSFVIDMTTKMIEKKKGITIRTNYLFNK